jgi:phage terminase Nu1 subunit (DNA packaging protein)
MQKGKSKSRKKPVKKKASPKKPNKQSQSELASEEKDVKAGETDKKPEKKNNKTPSHAEQLKAQKFEGLHLDEESGYYFADDVEIEEFDGKKIITAKDVLLTNAEKYQKHRALTEALKAEQLQMKLDLDRGRLIDGEALKKRIIKIGTETRDAIQNIPEQFGPDLLACKDLIELQTTLSHAINKALENLKRLGK